MGAQDESLEQTRTADQFFETIQAGKFQPTQNSGPSADLLIRCLPRVRQRGPVSRGASVMLAVIAVVEKEPIVEPTVVAHGAARVFKAAMQFAKAKADEPARQIDRQQESGGECRHPGPKEQRQRPFRKPFAAKRRPGKPLIAVMGEVSCFPKALRQTQQQRKKCGEADISGARTEEWQVNEVVRNGVRVPPQTNGDERH